MNKQLGLKQVSGRSWAHAACGLICDEWSGILGNVVRHISPRESFLGVNFFKKWFLRGQKKKKAYEKSPPSFSFVGSFDMFRRRRVLRNRSEPVDSLLRSNGYWTKPDGCRGGGAGHSSPVCCRPQGQLDEPCVFCHISHKEGRSEIQTRASAAENLNTQKGYDFLWPWQNC